MVSGVETSVWMVLHTGMVPSSRPVKKRMTMAIFTLSQKPKAVLQMTFTTVNSKTQEYS